jgi:hypothetical protein
MWVAGTDVPAAADDEGRAVRTPLDKRIHTPGGQMEQIRKPIGAADLLRMGNQDDALLIEDMSLCTLCSHTCDSHTAPGLGGPTTV